MSATRLDFRELLRRVRVWLNVQIRNGQLTERGLARRVAMSQSHIHNVLKGARILTPDTADRILKALGLTLLDFMEFDGLSALRDRPPGSALNNPTLHPPKRSASKGTRSG